MRSKTLGLMHYYRPTSVIFSLWTVTSIWRTSQTLAIPGVNSHLTSKVELVSPSSILTIISSPRTGIFSLTNTITRQLPTFTDNITHETIHPSALKQKDILPQLQANVDKNPALLSRLLPLEQRMREDWPYVPGKYPPRDTKNKQKPSDANRKSIFNSAIQLGQQTLRKITRTEIMKDAGGGPVYEKNWLGSRADETPFGSYITEWADKK